VAKSADLVEDARWCGTRSDEDVVCEGAIIAVGCVFCECREAFRVLRGNEVARVKDCAVDGQGC
jgi:hypothetical protein